MTDYSPSLGREVAPKTVVDGSRQDFVGPELITSGERHSSDLAQFSGLGDDRERKTLSVDREYPGRESVGVQTNLDRPGIPDNDV